MVLVHNIYCPRDSITLVPTRNVTKECSVLFHPCFHLQDVKCHFKTSVIFTNGFKVNEVRAGSKSQAYLPNLYYQLLHPSWPTLWVRVEAIVFHSLYKNLGSGWLEFLLCLPNSPRCPLSSRLRWQPCPLHSLQRPLCQKEKSEWEELKFQCT